MGWQPHHFHPITQGLPPCLHPLLRAAVVTVGVCELPAQPHICNSSAEKHQKICLVTEEILSILFCLKNKTKTIQGFALSNIWSELSTHLVSASRRLS